MYMYFSHIHVCIHICTCTYVEVYTFSFTHIYIYRLIGMCVCHNRDSKPSMPQLETSPCRYPRTGLLKPQASGV